MTTFAANERAHDVHRSIPKWMRNSAAPPVWRIYRKPWPSPIADDSLHRLDRCSSTFALASRGRDLTSVGLITESLLEENTMHVETSVEVFEYTLLKELFSKGQIPSGVPEATMPDSMEVALERAKELGYALPSIRERNAHELRAELNAFQAAGHLMRRRFSSAMKFFASRFIVPDPLQKEKTAYFLDQLWVARDEYHPDRVRLLGLEVGSDLAGGAEASQRDSLLAARGVEMFHASTSWARVDPQRVIHHFVQTAGLPVLQQFARSMPGKTIKKYLCAYCCGPMIRTSSGEGIVSERDVFVHESCFNAAADCGLFSRREDEPQPDFMPE
jgi:hypothetical protein